MRVLPALVVSLLSLPPVANAETGGDPMDVVVHTLDNGLTVYLSENHQEPRISAWVMTRAGASQDPRDATGMAHYLEHLLANKGTQRMGTLDHAAEKPHLDRIRALYDELFTTTDEARRAELYAQIDAEGQAANEYTVANELKQLWGLMGGRGLNAFTNSDMTAYVIDMPSNRLGHWARIEGDRFSSPVFRSFHTEVETVFEEKNRSLDNPARAMSDTLSRAVYGEHPYGTSTLGRMEHVKNPSVSKTYEFFERWYVPGNMAVLLAGDFDADEALALLEEHLGAIEAKPVTARERLAVAPIAGEQRVEFVHHDDEEVRIAWQTAPHGHPDHEALLVADWLLNNGSTGLIDRNLDQTQAVRKAGSFPDVRIQGGMQVVYGQPREGQTIEEVEQLLLDQIRGLHEGDFTDQDIQDIALNDRVRQERWQEYNAARVNLMGRAFLHGEDWDHARLRGERMASITREQVMDVAQRYFGEDRVVVVRREGQPEIPAYEAPPITELELNTEDHSALFLELLDLPAAPIELQELVAGEDFEVVETEAGRLYVTPNPYNDQYELRLRVYTGEGHEPTQCVAMDLWEKAGVGDMDLEAFERELYRQAASLYTSCQRWQTDVVLSGPRESLEAVWPLVVQRLREPVLSQEDLDKHIADTIAQRRDDLTSKKTLNRVLQAFAKRGEHSKYLHKLGDDALQELTLEQLRAVPAGLLDLQRVVFYAGPLGAAEIRALTVDPAATYATTPPRPPLTYTTVPATRILFLDYDSVQCDVSAFAAGEIFDPARQADYRLLSEYLGGNAGLIFQEIREARGMAYSAWGRYSQGVAAGDQTLVQGSLSTQADKTAEAAGLLLEMVRDVPLDDDRWIRSRDSLEEKLRTERITFRSVGWNAESWHRKGLEQDPRAAVFSALADLEPSGLDAFTARFDEQGLTLSILGDPDRVDMEALAEIAPVTRVTLDELISYAPVEE